MSRGGDGEEPEAEPGIVTTDPVGVSEYVATGDEVDHNGSDTEFMIDMSAITFGTAASPRESLERVDTEIVTRQADLSTQHVGIVVQHSPPSSAVIKYLEPLRTQRSSAKMSNAHRCCSFLTTVAVTTSNAKIYDKHRGT